MLVHVPLPGGAYECHAMPCAEHAERGELTYVHCKAGRGRSTTLVICYLIRQMRMSPEEAYAFVRTKRPQVCLAEGQWAAVREVCLPSLTL